MLLFLTTRGHQYTVASLVSQKLGAPAPTTIALSYDAMFRAVRIPDATIIFADLERLYPWELALAAEFYGAFRTLGLRCLNDPARVPARYGLLRRLHRAGINPFNIYHADDEPKPSTFPVFVRREQDHGRPLSGLLGSQAELDAFLERAGGAGTPLRGLVVIEFCGEPVAEGFWRRFGSFRVGDNIHVDHHVTEDSWFVKYGRMEQSPEWLTGDEHRRVLANDCPGAVRDAFQLANIEFGRADHTTVAGREVIYEINTNPMVGTLTPQPRPLRDETLLHAARTMAASLHAIDSGTGMPIEFTPTERILEHRARLADNEWSPYRP
jgi:hypothetical protein